jgi:pyruvate-ferredoxin/flavodoxin oxidoreductase
VELLLKVVVQNRTDAATLGLRQYQSSLSSSFPISFEFPLPRRVSLLSDVFNRRENHLVIIKPPCVEQHITIPDAFEIVRDLKVIDRLVLRQNVSKQFMKLRDVPLALAQLIVEFPLGLLPRASPLDLVGRLHIVNCRVSLLQPAESRVPMNRSPLQCERLHYTLRRTNSCNHLTEVRRQFCKASSPLELSHSEAMTDSHLTLDGNEAAARIAYRTNEVIAIYPITPASPMGEHSDLWSSQGQPNIWGTVPEVIEMQSEGGAAGAVHGALQAGSLTTTFTASQGLLLMLPNMYKIAGELTPTVFHIAARSVAAQALSIFGDHSDVMAARATGWAMLFAASVQEVMDFALIAQAATLESRIPFLHVFDGFRTSHEIQKVAPLSDDQIRALLSDELIRAHRARALSPDKPFIRGTAQNPDVFFQARESVNPFYAKAPEIVQATMDRLGETTGRRYRLFDYFGAPDADRIIVLMGSGAEAVRETVEHLNSLGESVGMIVVRLYRPFSAKAFLEALPDTARSIAVLDRTKEPGSAGEPLYQDVLTALAEREADAPPAIRVTGGRYGLSSKEFTPAMIAAIYRELEKDRPLKHFTIGIRDDVSGSSIEYDPNLDIEPGNVRRAIFWGLGSDGTVGANKNTIKIIGEETSLFAQGYFVYDSRKAGARTISHLRFGPEPIHSTYLIRNADFVAVHQFGFLRQYDTLAAAMPGATVLLNSIYGPDEVWDQLPRDVQQQVIDRQLKLFVIDAYAVAEKNSLGIRTNTIMQTCFFALSNVIPRDEAISHIKGAIEATYGKRGGPIVEQNFAAVDDALANLYQVRIPADASSKITRADAVPREAPDFVQEVTAKIIAGLGDDLPVSALPVDGTYPSGTTQWERRNLALEVPLWDPDLCIQCGKCVVTCPHSVIRAKVVDAEALVDAPSGFLTANASWRELPDTHYTLQVSVEDCTGCALCVEVCPVRDKSNVSRKAINMVPQLPLRDDGGRHWAFFRSLPESPPVHNGTGLKYTKSKDVQLLEPLFEFSGACAGCGETPYLSLLTRLFGDRAIIANATGCSSIYGGNLPTTPWTKNRFGRGPAWSNSLFEDNAEFGFGIRLAIDKQAAYARELLTRLREVVGEDLADGILDADHGDIERGRERIARLKQELSAYADPLSRDLLALADVLVPRSVWIVGGDGWAYDIGYGGLDHVLASGRNVNLLVLDTEVYSNTGGQASKATGLGAVAKFAAGGKRTPKKDLGMLAMSYGYVYVAQVAMGADDGQTIKAFREAEAYDGPSIIIAYSHCIAHGIDMAKGMTQQELAVKCGHWPLYRFDPRRAQSGQPGLQLDSRAPSVSFKDYAYNEARYRMLIHTEPVVANRLLAEAQKMIEARWRKYDRLSRENGTGTSTDDRPTPSRAGALPPGSSRPE